MKIEFIHCESLRTDRASCDFLAIVDTARHAVVLKIKLQSIVITNIHDVNAIREILDERLNISSLFHCYFRAVLLIILQRRLTCLCVPYRKRKECFLSDLERFN